MKQSQAESPRETASGACLVLVQYLMMEEPKVGFRWRLLALGLRNSLALGRRELRFFLLGPAFTFEFELSFQEVP